MIINILASGKPRNKKENEPKENRIQIKMMILGAVKTSGKRLVQK